MSEPRKRSKNFATNRKVVRIVKNQEQPVPPAPEAKPSALSKVKSFFSKLFG